MGCCYILCLFQRAQPGIHHDMGFFHHRDTVFIRDDMVKHRCLCDRVMEFFLLHCFYGITQFIIILDLLLSLITVTDTRE